MLQKIILLFLLLGLSGFVSHAHDFDGETMSYILSTPEASWSDFSRYVDSSGDAVLLEEISSASGKISLALSLPGKKYIVNYAQQHPDFSYAEIAELTRDDPMLSEIWPEAIYSFLSSAFQQERSIVLESGFFFRTIVVWFIHIISGYDHILFLLTLLLCLPHPRRILLLISSFTLAHCITLALGWLSIISLSSNIVEPIILLSIIIMAVYAIVSPIGASQRPRLEVGIVFILGLFHGLGFAWFFSEVLEMNDNIIIPLLWFNIWVELGQILIMLLALGLFSLVYTYFPKYTVYIKNTLSWGCIIAAAYWLLIRFL